MIKVIAVSALLALAGAKPAADAEADPQYLAAPNCKTVTEILTTQVCTPATENVCTTQTVDTEEIEYEKVCKEVKDMLCDAPAVAPVAAAYHAYVKREAEADAEADPQFFGGYPYAAPLAAPVAPVATAVASHVKSTVTHAAYHAAPVAAAYHYGK